MAVLQLSDVVVDYPRRDGPPVRAVAGVDLAVDRGQVVGLVGESGCGKSTLARAAVGLLPCAGGEVLFEGRPVRPLTRGPRPRELAGLQMVFQDPFASLNPRRKVGPQIADGMAILGTGARNRAERVTELLEQVGLPPSAARRYPHEFSGGQRQRVAIARALAPRPSVIVADEPISSLDASTQAQVANLLVALTRDLGVGLLFISHDLGIVRHVADTVAVMYLGTVVEVAAAGALWERPLHPYSEALMRAVPQPDGSGVLPVALPGEVGSPSSPPPGCRFHPRCPYVFDRCPVDVPPLLPVGGRDVACWLHEAGAVRLPGPPAERSA